ncbi:MAG: hypothetical protein J6W13_02990 [Salinivirgaceae bacterium]|nr:hypothetical protein [Salinivirgaceae bacterium]
MRKILLSALLIVVAVAASAQNKPQWIYKLPKAKNNTYRFVMEAAVANSENEARTQSIARVFQQTGNRLGQPVNTADINNAVQRGDNFAVLSSTFNIPTNKVCEWTERLPNGTYRVYVLCQVAENANIKMDAPAYNECNVNQEFKDGNALLKSMFIPGLGQIGKRHYVEGTLTLLGEAGLAGAGAYCYLSAQKKLDVMKREGVSYSDYSDAHTSYNRLRDASYVIWGAAAGLYVYNLFRAYTMQPKYKDGISLYPTVLPENERVTPGVAMRIKF